jgi:hypothetical protein
MCVRTLHVCVCCPVNHREADALLNVSKAQEEALNDKLNDELCAIRVQAAETEYSIARSAYSVARDALKYVPLAERPSVVVVCCLTCRD